MGRPSKQQLDAVMKKREEERGPGLFKRALGPVWGGVKAVGGPILSDLQWFSAGSSEAMQAIPSVPIPGQEDKRWSPYSGIMGGLVRQTPFGVASMALQLSGQKEKIQRDLEAQGKPSWLVAPHEAFTTPEMEAGGIRDIKTAEGMRQEEMGRQTREAFKQTIPQMDPLQFINPVTGYLETRRRLKDPMMEIHKQRPEAEQAQMQLLSPFEIATAPIPIEKALKGLRYAPKALQAGRAGLEAAGVLKAPLKPVIKLAKYEEIVPKVQKTPKGERLFNVRDGEPLDAATIRRIEAGPPQGKVYKVPEQEFADMQARIELDTEDLVSPLSKFFRKLGIGRKLEKQADPNVIGTGENLLLDRFARPLMTRDEWMILKEGDTAIKAPKGFEDVGNVVREATDDNVVWAQKWDAEVEAGIKHLDKFSQNAPELIEHGSSLIPALRSVSKFREIYNDSWRLFQDSLDPDKIDRLNQIRNVGGDIFSKDFLDSSQRKLLKDMNPADVLGQINKDYLKLLRDTPLGSARRTPEYRGRMQELLNSVDEVLSISGYEKKGNRYIRFGKELETMPKMAKRPGVQYQVGVQRGGRGGIWRGQERGFEEGVDVASPGSKPAIKNAQDVLDNLDDIRRQMYNYSGKPGRESPFMFLPRIADEGHVIEKGNKVWVKTGGKYQPRIPRKERGKTSIGDLEQMGWTEALKHAWTSVRANPLLGRYAIPLDETKLPPKSFAESLLDKSRIPEVRGQLNQLKQIIEKLPVAAGKRTKTVEKIRAANARRLAKQQGFSEAEIKKILSGESPNFLDEPIKNKFGADAERFASLIDEIFIASKNRLNEIYKGELNGLDREVVDLLNKIDGFQDPRAIQKSINQLSKKMGTDIANWDNGGLKGIYDLANAKLAFNAMWNEGIAPGNYSIKLMGNMFGADVGRAFLKHRQNSIANWLKWLTDTSFGKKLGLDGLERAAFPENWLGRGAVATGEYFGRMTPGELAIDMLMIPKTVRASFDLSAPLRQGLVLLFQDPVLWGKSFNTMLKLALPGGERGILAMENAMTRSPRYRMFTDIAGLQLTELGSMGGRTKMEEAFLSGLASRLPGVRASERAYTGFLNKLRFDTMDNMIRNLEFNLGRPLSPRSNPEDLDKMKKLASFINNATGRGALPWDKGGDVAIWKRSLTTVANLAFWSPRFLTSRIMLLPSSIQASRAMGKGMPEAVTGAVARTMVSWIGAGVTTLVMFKYLVPGADAELNPKSSNFGKIKLGNSYIDIWAGFGPIVRATLGLAGVDKVTGTGKYIERKPFEDTKNILGRFTQSKFSPTGGALFKYAPIIGTKKGFFGEDADIMADMNKSPFDPTSVWGQLFAPMMYEAILDAKDTYMTPMVPEDIAAKHGIDTSEPRTAWNQFMGIAAGISSTLPEFFGFSGATYYTKDDIAKELTRNWDEPRGYEELPQMGREPGIISQQRVKGLIKDIDAAAGVEYTKGDTGRMQELRDEEQTSIRNLGTMLVKVGDDTKSVNEWIQLSRRNEIPLPRSVSKKVTDEFYDIRGEYGIRRNEVLYGKKWARKRTPQELSRMGYKQRILQQYRDESSEARGSDEYNAVIDKFESMLRKSKHPEALQTINWIRLHAYDIDIPEDILVLLPRTSQFKYGLARRIREKGFAQNMPTGEERLPMVAGE